MLLKIQRYVVIPSPNEAVTTSRAILQDLDAEAVRSVRSRGWFDNSQEPDSIDEELHRDCRQEDAEDDLRDDSDVGLSRLAILSMLLKIR